MPTEPGTDMTSEGSGASPQTLIGHLNVLGDLARLRLLRLLAREELSVGELARALQTPQSTISRHLKLLHDHGWATKRSVGTASLYQLGDPLPPGADALWTTAQRVLEQDPVLRDDDDRLAEVLAARRTDSQAFFGRVAGAWDDLRTQMYGETFTVDALLNLVGADLVAADLGCGTGNAAEMLAPVVRKVIAVDREPAMLEAARKRLANQDNVDFRQGELTGLPIEDGEVDATLTVLVLHHVDTPEAAVAEMARVLKPGGRALIVDMAPHNRDEYRHTMGHQHLGFAEDEVRGWAEACGLTLTSYRRLRPDPEGRGPALFAATLRKPETVRS